MSNSDDFQTFHTKLCSMCLNRVEAEAGAASDVVATGELAVPFRLSGNTLLLALPIDQLRTVFAATDEAERQAAREQAEAHFSQATTDDTDTSNM
ncbi:hypothetical protein [uncultured Roseibium sp.]|uniref:hypothetical protein n=1 Tax=uncultured Roseibium sp. TaxID=1936171 RepID=UPI003216408D